MPPPSATLEFVLSGITLAVATLWFLRMWGRPLQRVQTLAAIVALLGAVALLWHTLLTFGYEYVVLSPPAAFGVGPFWRVLPAIAADMLSIVLFASLVLKSHVQSAKLAW